jgi:hypothetical protein
MPDPRPPRFVIARGVWPGPRNSPVPHGTQRVESRPAWLPRCRLGMVIGTDWLAGAAVDFRRTLQDFCANPSATRSAFRETMRVGDLLCSESKTPSSMSILAIFLYAAGVFATTLGFLGCRCRPNPTSPCRASALQIMRRFLPFSRSPVATSHAVPQISLCKLETARQKPLRGGP